ncbi:MAG: HAMP domain-containing sensor histidine kinase [Campylobacterota bacterium]|nr:HAMP domain-containing sensor histidine kinase [Campylobacterota bacterium]
MKLHQFYLRRFIALFIVLFLVVGSITYYWLQNFYIEQTKNALLQNIQLISYNLDKESDLDSFTKTIKDDLNIRVTIINKEGVVISESHKDKKLMDNHKYREEVMQSNSEPFGSIIRHSDTINKDFLYVVKKFTINDKIYYIRTAKKLSTINDKIFNLGLDIFAVLIIFFILLFYAAFKINTRVQKEIDSISKFLFNLTKKRKSSYIKSEFSQEFEQITTLLTKVSKILTKQDKQKSKYTAKLKASNEQKDNIISAISHEFKNPIAVINGYSQTLIDDPSMNQQIQTKFLKKIYKSGKRLSDLIDTLRLSIKLDEKKQTPKFKDVNIYNITQDSVESLLSNYKNREIQIQGDKENILIQADETLLSIAIVNLIENALKYSEDKVIVKLTNKSIQIIDTGIGISTEDMDKITDKFYRVSSNGWNNSLGLGLSIVSNIISLHNFKLLIESQENKGSTFSIFF